MKLSSVFTAILIISQLFYSTAAYAQYQVYHWASFEDAAYPSGYSPLSWNFDRSVRLVDLTLVPGAPSEFRSPAAARETGRFGLVLKSLPLAAPQATPNPEEYLTGIGTGVILQRDRLGENGKALYQADFFIPPGANPAPSIAVLAMEPLRASEYSPKHFYRFGITGNRHVYFSKVDTDDPDPKHVLYKFDSKFFKSIPRPGWHRFSIVFEGASTIHCYIDGVEAPFSPVEESSLKNLQVGIMLADPEKSYLCYVDNLSIQWTPEDVPLPDSPFIESWDVATQQKTSAARHTTAQPISPWPSSVINWLDVEKGKEVAHSENKSVLIYFQAPRVQATQILNEIIAENSRAQQFIAKYAPVKIDVNQLQGGTLAETFAITRVPTLMLLTSDGQEIGRAAFTRQDTWETLEKKLNGSI